MSIAKETFVYGSNSFSYILTHKKAAFCQCVLILQELQLKNISQTHVEKSMISIKLNGVTISSWGTSFVAVSLNFVHLFIKKLSTL